MGAGRIAALPVVWALLLAVGCSSFGGRPVGHELSPRETAKAQALAHFSQGLLSELAVPPDGVGALNAYLAAAAADPDEIELHNMAARLAVQLGRSGQALTILEQAVREQRHRPEPQLALGHLAMSLEDYALAQRSFRLAGRYHKVPAIRVEDAFLAAYTAFMQGADRQALSSLETALRYGAGRPFASEQQEPLIPVRLRAMQFALDLAVERLNHDNPATGLHYLNWAEAQATNRFERADLQERYGSEAWHKHQRATAIAALRRAAAADPLRSHAELLALATERETQQLKISDVARLLKEQPANIALRLGLARMLIGENFHHQAQTELETTIGHFRRRFPREKTDPALWLMLGACLERQQLLEKAEDTFRAGLAEHPDSAAMQNYLAYMLAEQGLKLDEAETLVKAALAQEPENYAYQDTLGWICYQAGRYEEALIWLNRAAEDRVVDPVIFDHLGDTLQKLGRQEEAIGYWAICYRLDRKNRQVADKLTAAGVDPASVLIGIGSK